MPRRAVSAFTLIELMITVCIIGVLASVALPTYQRFVYESRAAEAVTNMSTIYKGAVAYYERPISGQGITASGAGHCVVYTNEASPERPPFPPGPEKRAGDFAGSPTFSTLGFTPRGPVYFVYLAGGIVAPGFVETQCDIPPDMPLVFGVVAACDMNGDGMIGGYAQFAGTRDGEMFRWPMNNANGYWEAMGGVCPFCAPGIN